jgi:hypothetical protein
MNFKDLNAQKWITQENFPLEVTTLARPGVQKVALTIMFKSTFSAS